MEWPAQSPDINPIENVRKLLYEKPNEKNPRNIKLGTNLKGEREKICIDEYKRLICSCSKNVHYIYCHVVSHWDDRNKITTILVFELTVASHQRMTVKNRCLYSVTSLGSPDMGRKKVEAKWLAGTVKTEVAPSTHQRKKEKE